ncbi:hypothetical protein [Novacetimonas cocois]|uniref:Uncharacterized protein n=1 Tax=Novacetimonas cocois TaxID=1747507 RepID=A0A365YR98_9PROT|nr:hypothetical protein [Novacetimonas cocois]RBM05296.1 hypothetical protein NJLHNGOC_13570 [Novacetimonas cocois]
MAADLPPEPDPRSKLTWIILTILLTVLLGGYMVISEVRALVNAQVETPEQPDGNSSGQTPPPSVPVPPEGSPQPSKTPNAQ